MKKELTMALIIILGLIADSICFRQIYWQTDAGYPKASFGFLLIAGGAGLLGMFAFFIKRLLIKQVS